MSFIPKFALQNSSASTTAGATNVEGASRINGVFAQRLAARGNGLVGAVNQNHAPQSLTPNTGGASKTPGTAGQPGTTGSDAETQVPDYIQAQMAFFFKNQGSFKLPNADPWEDD